MELIADRYRNGWGAPGVLRRESGASSGGFRLSGALGSLKFSAIRLAAVRRRIRISRVRQDQGTAGISQAMEYDFTSERPRVSKSFRPMPDAGV
jgi:hypothetical protein